MLDIAMQKTKWQFSTYTCKWWFQPLLYRSEHLSLECTVWILGCHFVDRSCWSARDCVPSHWQWTPRDGTWHRYTGQTLVKLYKTYSTSLCWQVSKQVKISFSHKCYNWSCANFKNTTNKKKSLFSVIHDRNVFLSIECHGVVKVSWLFFGKVVILA